MFNSQACPILEIRSSLVMKTLEDEWYVVIKGCISLSMQVNTLSTFLGLSRPAIDQYKGHPKELIGVETGNQKTSQLHTSWRIHPADLQMSNCTQCQYTYPPFCVALVCIVPRPSTNGLGMRLGMVAKYTSPYDNFSAL